MYRLSPFTYLVSGMLQMGGGADIVKPQKSWNVLETTGKV